MTHSSRRTLLAHMARFIAALPLIDLSRAMAQQRVPRIGFMSGAEPSLIASFEDEMRKLGHVPARTFMSKCASRGLSLANRQTIVDFAAAHRLPAVYQSLFFVESGGLVAWAPDQRDQ